MAPTLPLAPRRAAACSRRHPARRAAGVTLIELLAVILVVAILVGLGVPSYRYVTNDNRVASEIDALLGDMQYARSEAVKEGQMVTICPSQSQTACDSTNHWENGWIVFSDVNGNQTVAAQSDILRVQAALPTAGDTLVSDSGLDFLSFNREGFATQFPATVTGYATITLHTTPSSSTWTRCLQVFTSGMMATETTSNSQGNCT